MPHQVRHDMQNRSKEVSDALYWMDEEVIKFPLKKKDRKGKKMK
jgi:hypothetical protein